MKGLVNGHGLIVDAPNGVGAGLGAFVVTIAAAGSEGESQQWEEEDGQEMFHFARLPRGWNGLNPPPNHATETVAIRRTRPLF